METKITFKEFLMELMVSDDPMQAKRDIMMAQKNPDMYQKSQIKGTLDRSREIQGDKENPNKAEEMRVNDSERKLMLQKKRLADKQKAQAKAQGAEQGNDMNIRGDTGERPAAGMVP